MEIINSVVAIITTEDVNAAIVHDCRVPIARRWWLRPLLRHDFEPVIRLKAEPEEVVSSVRAVVPSEDIEVILKCNRGVKGTRTWRMTFVGLRWFDLMPSIWLLKKVVSRSTNDVLARERVNGSECLVVRVGRDRLPGIDH